MGNQGMTNWKFSVFFVIALTLVAGLFADTALAGNGDGTIVLDLGALLPPDAELVAAVMHSQMGCSPTAIPQVLKAGSIGLDSDIYLHGGRP